MKKIILGLICSVLVFQCSFLTVYAAPAQDFEEWLERYGAWDRLEKEYADTTTPDTPETLLKRAEVFLNLNSPEKALELIEMTTAFSDPILEAKRLWLGGQAQRGLGELTNAVLWFTQSANFMDDETIQARFSAESDLETIWQDVWLKLYWSFESNFTLSRNTQKTSLNQIVTVGKKAWKTGFWNVANQVLQQTVTDDALVPAAQGLPMVQSSANNLMRTQDTLLVVRAISLVSLEKFSEAKALLAELSSHTTQTFWNSIVQFAETGNLSTDQKSLNEGNYLKASAFWSGNILASQSTTRQSWYLGNPDSGPWTKFRNNILTLTFPDALKTIDNELGSMLISEQTTDLLNNFKLALSLAEGKLKEATTIWNNTNKKNLPITLRLAGMLAFKDDLKDVLPGNSAEAYHLYPVLSSLSGAAGFDVGNNTIAPFWTKVEPAKLRHLTKEVYPLDRLLLLAYWQQVFHNEPTTALAKRAAYLFDDASFGIQCMIYLADEAVRERKLQLGAYYLNKLDKTALPSSLKTSWLDIKTRLELESGRQGAALKTYKEMDATPDEIPVMTRLRMALLYQQRKEYTSARKELLHLWEQRESLTTALQAETLFWLGEGEYAMGDADKALDYYLKLAWQYPQENIWCLTAMYRASLIYEKRGKYQTAKKLLGTVVRNASRKEQREAAKARINAIDKKMGQERGPSESTIVYPF